MKLYHSIMSLVMVAALSLFTGCSADGYWDAYSEDGVTYTFAQSSLSYSITPADELNEITVSVVRSNAAGATEIPVTVKTTSKAFSAPATVSFEDGKVSASYKVSVDVAKIAIGAKDGIELSFDDKAVNVAISGNQAMSINVSKDYTWVAAGSAQVYSSWVGNWDETGLVGKGIKVPVEKALEGDGLYRLNSLYNYMEPSYCKNKGYHIQFTVDNDFQPIDLPRMQYIGETGDDGEYVLMFLPSGDYAGVFVLDDGMYVIQTVMGAATAAGASLVNYESIAFTWTR